MARKSPTILQEELYPSGAEPAREWDDARLVDLDVDEEPPFLRAQKRVSARRTTLPKKTVHWLLWGMIATAGLCVLSAAAGWLYRYGERSWRFRVESSDNIEITGMQNVTKAQIMEVMGADIGRNIFFIPLSQQKAQLEQIPWVESASVMRFVPNRLKIEIHERTPMAFARVGPRIFLIDAGGTLMELPQKRRYSFPVILGMNPGEPLSTRIPRMKAYRELMRELDSGGARYSQDLSEVDLSDLDNIKVRVNDPAGDVLVQLGSSDYLKRYTTYVSHAREWRQQFQKLESVNLRYDNQVIVNPDLEGTKKQPGLSVAAVKAARAAGVKPAALVTHMVAHDRAALKPVFEVPEKNLNPTDALKKPSAKTTAKRPLWKRRKKAATTKKVAEKSSVAPKPANSVMKQVTPHSAGNASQPHAAQVPATAATTSTLPKPSPAITKQQGSSNPN